IGELARGGNVDEGEEAMPDEQEVSIEVHGLIAKSFTKEYVEAVVADALRILPAYKHRKDTLVVINARRVAVQEALLARSPDQSEFIHHELPPTTDFEHCDVLCRGARTSR